MDGNQETKLAASGKPEPQTRQRSSIAFPYADLQTAIDVAQALHDNVGRGECDDDQLAAWRGQSPKSSTFRVQIYASRTFGVLEGDSGLHKLTQLGLEIVDPSQERAAKVEAFLNVPLFKAMFENYKGGVLPPAATIEREMVKLGVSEKQKDRARVTFEKSAEQAGFFQSGRNRLVMPGIISRGVASQPPPAVAVAAGEAPMKSGGEPPSSGLHPFIQGLLKTLPEPEGEWDAAGRVKWLQTAANIFDLIYKGDVGIEVNIAGASRSPRPRD